MNNEKINSIYDDVNKAKGIVKGYLIGAGAMAGIEFICLIYFVVNAILVKTNHQIEFGRKVT